jgi:hypothetical protein
VADAGLSAEVRRGVSVIQPCEPLSYFPSLPENVLQDTTQIGIQSAMSGLELVAGIAGVAAAAIKVSVSLSKCRSRMARVTCTDSGSCR